MPKNNIHAEARDNDMYRAIDGVISKLDKQVIKYKEKISDHRQQESLKLKNKD
jgi:putative sigma-54 modulation protein